MATWIWIAALLCGSQAAVLPPPWADVRRNPCASHPRGWLMLYWPSDGKCYTIYKVCFIFEIFRYAKTGILPSNFCPRLRPLRDYIFQIPFLTEASVITAISLVCSTMFTWVNNYYILARSVHRFVLCVLSLSDFFKATYD